MKLREINKKDIKETIKTEAVNEIKTKPLHEPKIETKNELVSSVIKDLTNNSSDNNSDNINAEKNVKEKTNQKKNTIEKVNIHKDHRSRLKSKFLSGDISSLTEIQMLELLLFYSIPQKDTNPTSHLLLDKFKSLKNVLNADVNKLMEVNGVKENSATLIKLVSSLFRYLSMPSSEESISSVTEASEYCKKLFTGVEIEQFYVICLSKSNKIKLVKMVESGTTDEISIQIRNITELALESKCNRIIISHNHPLGYAKMSDEDCSFTYSLICSCLLNSIDVIDHIIVGGGTAISLASQKIIQKLKEKAIKNINIPVSNLMLISNQESLYEIDE